MRLDKAIARNGLTRQMAKKAIAGGRARVNGNVVLDPGYLLKPEDEVLLDGENARAPENVHLMLHKPAGFLTATEDARGERTVLDLLPEKIRMRKVGPVGRLDKDVTGLLILTTDGQLAHRLISPKWDVKKTYYAEIEGEIDDECVRRFAEGVPLKEFTCKPARLERAGAGACRVYVSEGKYHQVKRMLAAVGHPVLRLKREKIGPVALDPALSEGEFRPLTPGEEAALYEIAGMTRHE